MLALVLKTSEPDLIGNAGSISNTKAIAALDPVNETYEWFKVIKSATNEDRVYAKFTPDGTKILVQMRISDLVSLVYLRADTGAQIGATRFTACCP